MRGKQAIIFQLTTCLLLTLSLVLGLEMPFLEKNITKQDIDLRLNNVRAGHQPELFTRYNISFTGKKRSESLSLDERCNRGLPLSVRWTEYGPYVSLIRGDNQSFAQGVGLTGIFPSVINTALAKCCHENTRVVYGHYINTLKNLEASLSRTNSPDDLMFPVGLQSMDMDVFKDLPVVPLLRAPRTTLLVPEIQTGKTGKTLELFKTVGMAWPILAFIFLAAIISGVFIWVLDHISNPDEFPVKFSEGVWEGFWWAVVTMTTVGYGDRAPRSIFGRLFCIIWIVIGMSIIAIFTGMVTTSLSASIQENFVIHGLPMGAVDGSQEERIGTGMNADMLTYGTPKDVVESLVDTKNLEVAIMDSYLLTYFHAVIKREPVRVKANLEQPINYGLVLAPNSKNFTECFTKYIKNNPQDIFKSIRENLKPLKNPTDEISEEVIASQGFLQEKAFQNILFGLAGVLGGLFILGLIWECFISGFLRTRFGKKSESDKPKKGILQSLIGFRLAQNSAIPKDDLTQLELIKEKSTKIRQLIREFDDFYEKWMEKLKEVTNGDEEWGDFKQKPKDTNVSFMMVTYNDEYGNSH